MKRLVKLLLLVIVVSARAVAQDAPAASASAEKRPAEKNPAEKGTAPSVLPLKVAVAPAQEGTRDIFDQLTLFVDLENPTGDRIQIERIYLLVGDDVLLTRPPQNHDAAKEWKPADGQKDLQPSPYNYPEDGQWSGSEKASGFDIPSEGRKSITLTIPAADIRESGVGGLLSYVALITTKQYLLTFTPQEHNIHVVVDYSNGADKHFSQRTSIKVRFTATWGAIMVGGLVGVLLLLVLRITVALVDEAAKVLKPQPNLSWSELRNIGAALLQRLGWVGISELIGALVWIPSVIVICVLLMRMEPGSFPITFQVNDFTGGVLLGLFTRTLIEPLIRKLFPPAKGG
jgi:hypothetical protein